jgi:hypothetical protein
MNGMTIKDYVGDINGGSLMLNDSLILAEYLLQEPDKPQWKHLIVDQNVLQRKSPNTALRAAATVRKRLSPLGHDFLKDILNLPERAYVQLLMVALLVQSPIMADFMRNVLAEARRVYKAELSHTAWQDFIDDRCRSWPELNDYSEETYKKIGKNVIRALAEADYLDSSRNKRIQAVYVLPETKNWLDKLNRTDLIDVMECTF